MPAAAQIVVTLRDEASDALQKIGGSFASLGNIVSANLISDGIKAMGSALFGFGQESIKVAGDFEAGMLQFKAAAGDSLKNAGLSVDQFKQQFLQLGAELPVSTSEVQQAAIALIKGGLDPAVVAAGGLKSSLQFAAAAGMDLTSAAELGVKAMGTFVPATASAAEQSAFLAKSQDLLVKAAGASTLNVDTLGQAMLGAAGQAKAAGVDYQDFVTVMGMISPAFGSAAEAGTGYKNFLARIQPTTRPAIDAMTELGLYTEKTGSAFYDAQGQFVGNAKAAELLMQATKNLTPELKASYLQTIFGNDAMGAAVALASGGADAYNAFAAKMAAANGVQAQAETVMQGYNIAMENAKGSVEALQITIGSMLLPVLTALLNQGFAPAVNAIQAFVTPFANASDPVLYFAQALGSVSPALSAVANYLIALVRGSEGVNEWLAATPPLFQAVVGAVSAFASAIQPLVAVIQANLLPALIGVGAVLGTSVIAVMASLAAPVIAAAAPFLVLAAAVAALAIAFNTNFLGIRDLVTTIFGTLITMATNVATAFQQGGIGGALNELGNQVTAVIPVIAGAITALVTSILSQLLAATPGIITTVGQWALAFLDGLTPAIPAAINGVTQIVTGVIGAIGAGLPGIITAVGEWALNIADWAVQSLPGMLAALGTLIGSVIVAIASAAPGIATAVLSWAVAAAMWAIDAIPLVTGGVGELLGSLVSALLGGQPAVAGAFTSLFSGVGEVISGVLSMIVSVIQGAITLIIGAWNGISDAVSIVGSAFNGLLPIITGVMSSITSAVAAGFSAMMAVLSGIGTAISPLATIIGAVFSSIVATISGYLASIAQVVASMLGVVVALWSQYGGQIMTTVATIFAQVVSIISGAIQIVMTIVQALAPFFAATFAVIGVAIGVAIGAAIVVINSLTNIVTSVFSGIASFISANSSTIASTLMGSWNIITGVIRAALSLIQGIISATLAALQGNWAGAWQAIVTGVVNATAGIRTAISGIVALISGSAQLVLNAALAIGKNIVQGIISGITSSAGGIATAAANAAASALNAAKSALGIRSPSKVMADQVGSQIPAGVAQGISQNSNVIPGAMNEAIGKAIGLIQQGVGAFGALRSFAAVPQQAINDFAAAVTASMDALGGALASVGAKAAAATGAFAENASKVVGLIGQGVTAFNALSGFSAVPQATLGAFAMQVADAVYSFDQALSAVGMEATVRASAFAQAAQGVVDVIGKGVQAFTALAGFTGVADSAIQSFSASLGTAVAAFSMAAEAVGNTAMANASAFAGSAASVVDTIGKGVTAFTALSSYQGVADSAIQAFSSSLQTAVAAFASAAEGFSSGMLAQTDAFATTGGKVTEAIAKGVEGFTKLSTFAGVAQAAFDSFMAALQMAVSAFAAAGQNVSAESLKAASAIATTANSVVQVIGQGVDAFTKLAAFKGVAAGALDGFIASIQAAIQSFATAAASSNQEALAAARKWAQEVGQIAQMISQGVQSFSSMQNAKPFEAVATNLTQAMTAGLEKLKAAVEGGMSAAASALAGSNSKIASASKGMGNAIVQGAAAGVKEKAKELASAAVAAAQSAVSAAKDSLQIRSPSKVANEQIGQPFSQGIAAGITAAAKGINMSALGAVNKVMDVVQKAILALAQLGSVGNVSSGTISKFTTALQQVLQGIVNANKTISGAAVKSAAQFAEGCGKMLALVGQGVDAFNKLATFIAPADSKITAFVGVIAKIVSAFQQALQAMKKQMQKDAQAFADVTTKIVGVVGTGVEAISKLGTLIMPSDKSISLFAEALGKVLDAIIGVAYSMGSSVTSAAASFAESAVKAISIISSGVDAFNKLAGFKGILDSDLATFKTALTSALTMLIALAQKFQGEGLAVAASFAESAGKIIGLIGTGVDNLTKLSGFKGVTDEAFASFKASLTKALTTIVSLVGTWEQTALSAAAQFAEQAGKIVGLFGSASDAFGKLADIQAVPASAFETFAASLKSAISAIAAAAKDVTSGAAQAAASFAESASKVVSLLSAGSDAFKKLNDVGAVSDAAIAAFAANIKAAILGLKDVIAAVGSELPSQAAQFAESATKVMSLISAGTDAFKKLADLAAVPDEAIAAFASALTRVLTALKDTFSTWDADALKAAQSFGDAIQKVLSMLATGTDAFKKLADLTDIPDSAVSAFASALNRTVTALKDMFAAWDADALKAAQQFGDSIQKVLSMLSAGVDAFKKLSDMGDVPDSAITAFATALNTTITKLQTTFSTWSTDALDAAKTFGDAVQKVLAMVSTGSDAFKKLAELSAVPESAIDTFVQGLKAAMNALTKISTMWSTDALNQAKVFSESVQKVMAAFAAGASAFIKIAENHGTMPTGTLQALAQSMNAALTILATLALTWTKDALAYAESYAESTKKIMSALKESSQAFKSMKDFQGVPVKAIQGLADAIQTTVTTIYQIANQTGEMIDAANQFMSAASGTLTALGLAVNGFGVLEKFKAIPPKTMASFGDALTETITLLSELSAQWSADAMTAIKDFTVATGAVLSALKDSVDGFAKISSFKDTPSKAISALAAAIEQVVNAISGLASQVNGDMMDAATAFATSTNAVLDSLVSAIDAFNAIGKFKTAPTAAISALQSSLSTVLTAIQGLASQWSGDALSAAKSFASGALEVVKSVKDAMDAIASIGNYKDQASGIVSAFGGALSKIVSDIKSTAIPQAEALGKAIAQGVADGITANTSAVTSAIADLVAAIKKALESATSAAKDAGSAIASAIASSLKSAASDAKSSAGAIESAISSAMKSATSAAQSGGKAISSAFSSAMQSTTSAVSTGMASALAAVRNATGGFASAGQSVGQSLAGGISRGISGAVSTISRSAAGAVTSAISAARSAAQINSPSKLAALKVGLPIGQGIAQGINQAAGQIAAAGRDAAGAAIQPSGSSRSTRSIAGTASGSTTNQRIFNIEFNAHYTREQSERSARSDLLSLVAMLEIR